MPIEEGHNRSPCSRMDRPVLMHFFKIILPSVQEDKKLRLPFKFVRKFGVELSDVAQLSVPSGHTWKLGLKKDQEKIWFDEGWHDFVEHHFIDYGFFLVFAYRGCSNFNVFIFDLSACEIQYPCIDQPTKSKSNETNRGETVEDEGCFKSRVCKISSSDYCGSKTGVIDGNASKEKFNDSAEQNLGMKKFGRCVPAALQESQSLKHVSNKKSSEESVREKGPEIIDLDDGKEEGPEIIVVDDDDTESRKRKLNKKNDKMVRAAQMFKPKNPSFMVSLQPYSFRHRVMHMPLAFSRRHMRGVPGDIKLEVSFSNGRRRDWPVRVHRQKDERLFLSQGWTQFVEENGLVEGDVCVFECVEEDNSVLKVSIFR